MGVQASNSASAPGQKRTMLPSSSPAEHLTVGALLGKRRKFEEEMCAKEQAQRQEVETKSQKKERHSGRKTKVIIWTKIRESMFALIFLLSYNDPFFKTEI